MWFGPKNIPDRYVRPMLLAHGVGWLALGVGILLWRLL
jgi:hypothetical protein